MAPLKSLSRRLTRTQFGQKALAQPEGLGFLKQKPTPRVYVGLGLVALSYLIVLPTLALLGYLSLKLSKPMIIAVGGPVFYVLVHVMAGAGAYLAGRNYLKETLLWITKRFMQRYAN